MSIKVNYNMKLKKSQIKSIIKTTGQLFLLVALFVLVGFVVPIRIAPSVADFFSITTPYEAAREVMSVRLENRNVSSGGSFRVGVSDPASSVRISSLSYSCEFSGITLAYKDGGDVKGVPCDTALELPQVAIHELMAFTEKSAITYLPIELVLKSEDRVGMISVVVAVAARNAEEISDLPNESTATLQSFPAHQ